MNGRWQDPKVLAGPPPLPTATLKSSHGQGSAGGWRKRVCLPQVPRPATDTGK